MKTKELAKIKNLVYFTRETLSAISPEISRKSLELNIYRWLKKGELLLLKKGFYLNREIAEKYFDDIAFKEFIAGRLLYPSYLSLEYVLRKHEVLTEATFGVTSVTTKIGRKYKNKLDTFIYKNIQPDLFTGYEAAYFLDNEYFIASKAKALFDFIYFKSFSLAKDLENRNFAEDLRLNLDNFFRKDLAELKKFATKLGSPKINLIINNIIQNAPSRI